ncbi:hypothetical protein IGI04_011354 [Brassica rapa subsp. trilocularis]|uniref:GH18 domain-containing protein n=1 Tax=Brassica rapa subsp. trilocularis TaxID=1813537 RepID=A0ABQ7N587_BRACM|nr:hypothetical protein IGI04_011354 [Brassica rapa subsp. trilocularis]
MARRREKRSSATESSERRHNRDESKPRDGEPDSDRRLITIFVVFFIVIPAVSMAVYKVKFADRVIEAEPSIRQKGIIKTDIHFQEILTEHSKASENSSDRHYDYPVLAYITPWNSKGYDMAKIYNSKFTHLSPVWYDLKSQGNGLVLEGRHNADKGWIQELRSKGNAMILPRVVLEAVPEEMLKKKKLRAKAINLIVTECKEMEFDGIVLESWSRWAAYGVLHDPDMRKMALQFVKQLGDALHEQQMQFMYVIGPPRSDTLQMYDFGPDDLKFLKDSVDGFSLMTYDFSNSQNPGPNAPLKWIDITLKLLLGSSSNVDSSLAKKVLLGLNFYGNDFAISGGDGGAITGRDYLALLQKHKPTLHWDKESGEHLFMYRDDKNIKHAVFYPSLMSILLRLENARLWGIGISIWEIVYSVLTPKTSHPKMSRVKQAVAKIDNTVHKEKDKDKDRERAMEALKTASFSPTSVLSDKRSETRKPFSLPSLFPPKPPKPISQESLFRSFNGGLALLTSVLSSATAPAKSLTYEEALQQSTTSPSSFDSDGLIDGISSFVTDNPLVIAGGVAAFAVPFVLSQVLNKKPKSFGVESAKNAYTKLGTDENAQLLDIRAAADLRQVGSPNIKGLGKKTVSAVYNGEDKPGFLKKLSLKFKDPENTTLFILDKFDGNSELVAELVALNGFKSAYAIKDGAEGPRGWVNSGLPWIEPKKNLSLDLSSLTDSISGVFGESSDGVSVAIGVAAAAGLSVLAFTEIETILQLLGSAALVQLAGNKLLFAEDRKQTLKQVDEFLNTKVAPKELVDELKDIGKAFLPLSTSSKALPPPAAEAATTITVDEKEPEPAIKAATAQVTIDPATEAATEQVITEPTKTEAKPKPYPRPLSPYASYPDLKPPTSPTPVSSKGLPAPAPVAAEAATTTIVDEPEPELEPAIKAATVQVNSEPAAEAATEQVITEAKPKSHSRPLSPYASYPDLKPPTSPTPSHP